MKVFRIDILIPIKNALQAHWNKDVSASFPERFDQVSRVPARYSGFYGNFKYTIGSIPDIDLVKMGIPENYSAMLLSIRYSANSHQDSLSTVREGLGAIFDNVSFQIHESLFPRCIDITDVSGEIAINDVREFYFVKDPISYLLPKYCIAPAHQGFSFSSNLSPSLEAITYIDANMQVALWWYFKVIQTNNLIDKSVFLFIILDIVCKPYALSGPFIPKCGHVIDKCTCGESILKELPGESIKLNLIESGFSNDDAEFLWKARQFAHGVDFFSPFELQKLYGLINKLHMYIFEKLEEKLGIIAENRPTGGTDIIPSISEGEFIHHQRQITKLDIEIEKALNELKE